MQELKNAIISDRIIRTVEQGHTVAEAVDIVLGAGTWERFASDLYDALRAKGGVA